MNYENVAVNVKSDDNSKIVIETSEGLLRTYHVAPKRMMYLYGETLQVSMRADPIYPSTDDKLGQPLELIRQIEGTVILKEQLVSVIGDSRSSSNKLKIVFQSVTSEQKCGAEPIYTRAKVMCIRLNQRSGDGPEWVVLCMVSPDTLDAIATAVASETLCALTVGIMFKNIYIDDDDEEEYRLSRGHHWMDRRPVKEWYLRPDLTDHTIEFPEDAYGAVTYLDLALGTIALSQQPDTRTESGGFISPTSSLAALQPDQHNTAFNLIATNIEKLRTVVTWVGGIIALILLVLVFK